MRVLFCVQRYGAQIVGGGESLCREVALHLSSIHEVSVATSCATDYRTWENTLSPGASIDEGCTVHRFPVRKPRDTVSFDAMTRSLLRGSQTLADQIAWMQAHGPDMPALTDWLTAQQDDFDVVVFFTAEYAHAHFGVPAVTRRPVILQPLAHDTPYLRLQTSIQLLEHVRYHVYNTPEERALVASICTNRPEKFATIGVGIEPVTSTDLPWPDAVVPAGTPYLLYVGRFDESKGCMELLRHFQEYLRRHPQSPLHLVFAGPGTELGTPTPRIHFLGRVDAIAKASLFRHAMVNIVPSPFESLSMTALEGWMHERPLLANGRCAVLSGQAVRSNGGLTYDTADTFMDAVDWLVNHPSERARMGICGRAYVEANYGWPHITHNWNEFLADCVDNWHCTTKTTSKTGTQMI